MQSFAKEIKNLDFVMSFILLTQLVSRKYM